MVITDGWRGCSGIEKLGCKHIVSDKRVTNERKILLNVHLVVSLQKR
jgi:hypothetical protein